MEKIKLGYGIEEQIQNKRNNTIVLFSAVGASYIGPFKWTKIKNSVSLSH